MKDSLVIIGGCNGTKTAIENKIQKQTHVLPLKGAILQQELRSFFMFKARLLNNHFKENWIYSC